MNFQLKQTPILFLIAQHLRKTDPFYIRTIIRLFSVCKEIRTEEFLEIFKKVCRFNEKYSYMFYNSKIIKSPYLNYITHLYLHQDLSPTFKFSKLSSLEYLSLSGSKITPKILKEIGKCINLISLDLSRQMTLRDNDLKYFLKLKNLQRLNLNGTFVSDEGLKNLSVLGNLVSIDIGGCKNITFEGAQNLFNLPKLTFVAFQNHQLMNQNSFVQMKLKE